MALRLALAAALAMRAGGTVEAAQSASGTDTAPRPLTKLERVSLRIDTVDAEIHWRGELLWRGTVRLNRMTAASRKMELRDAVASACLPITRQRTSETDIEFVASKYGGNATDPDRYRMAATIWHRAMDQDCRAKQPVGFSASWEGRMGRGQRREIRGDDGMLIRLHRRWGRYIDCSPAKAGAQGHKPYAPDPGPLLSQGNTSPFNVLLLKMKTA